MKPGHNRLLQLAMLSALLTIPLLPVSDRDPRHQAHQTALAAETATTPATQVSVSVSEPALSPLSRAATVLAVGVLLLPFGASTIQVLRNRAEVTVE